MYSNQGQGLVFNKILGKHTKNIKENVKKTSVIITIL